MSAQDQLNTLNDEREAIGAQLEAENALSENVYNRMVALQDELSNIDSAIATARHLLVEAFRSDPTGQSEQAITARNDIKALIKQREKIDPYEYEIEAMKAAQAEIAKRCAPMTERLMALAEIEKTYAAQRLKEYGEELAARFEAVAKEMALLYAEGHAMNQIARESGMGGGPFVALPERRVLDLPAVGKPAPGGHVLFDFEDRIGPFRQDVIDRLHEDGFRSAI